MKQIAPELDYIRHWVENEINNKATTVKDLEKEIKRRETKIITLETVLAKIDEMGLEAE